MFSMKGCFDNKLIFLFSKNTFYPGRIAVENRYAEVNTSCVFCNYIVMKVRLFSK